MYQLLGEHQIIWTFNNIIWHLINILFN